MCAIAVVTQVLKTKLYPPRLPGIVTRERLLKELDAAATSGPPKHPYLRRMPREAEPCFRRMAA